MSIRYRLRKWWCDRFHEDYHIYHIHPDGQGDRFCEKCLVVIEL